jgi:hypothetical protein
MAHRKSAKSLLVGTWRSDRRRTLAQWVYPKRLASDRKATFEAIFGRLLVKFTRSRHSTIYDGQKHTGPYRVIWSQEGPTFPQLVVVYGRGKNGRAQHSFSSACPLTNRWSGRVQDKVPSSNVGMRAAKLNR